MIQFNLLPDIKLEYIRAQKMKRSIILIALISTGISIAVVSMLAINVYGLQREHIRNLSSDIAEGEETIQSIDQFDRILTVQNQLLSLPDLHSQKPEASRLYEYIETVVPSDVRINRVELDFEAATLRFTGQADDLSEVNRFVDTLKFTNYVILDDEETDDEDSDDERQEDKIRAFSSVVLTNFSRDPAEASYTIDLEFDSTIFDTNQNAQLVLEKKITTRSQVERPEPLFSDPIIEESDNAEN